MKSIKVLLLMVMSVVLAACGGDGGGKEEPAEVAENFMDAMIDGDSETVIDLMYLPADMQAELDNDPEAEEMLEEKLSVMMDQLKAEIDKNGGIDDISTGEVSYNSDKTQATVPVTITLEKDGESDTNELTLIKTDDGWKVEM